ncbi:hypothetical protein HX109_07610 [Galbibacter sp. BG1]|uniref:hypothetical protein n=1 Tax=Galbibacter sp. BG1 TaxID=1170699 RepID=UPI0015BE20A6|nr:hypothetical protein [Galbibacter sp. BG1]QLE01436.1 hypothetical protein HX109_07610 [Galbibacter sp. BG1]
MKKLFIIIVVASFSIAGCKQEEKKNNEPSKMEMVMAVHDSLMPKMNTITKLIGDLNTKVDTTEVGKKYEMAKQDLQAAHKSMMDWMKEFGDRFDHEEILNGKELSEEKKEWLKEEEEKVKALKEEINSSIENAEKLLNEKL